MKDYYTVSEASKRWKISKGALYQAIREKKLHALLRRGCSRGYLLTDEIIEDWFDREYMQIGGTV